jgi:hypothetical protein
MERLTDKTSMNIKIEELPELPTAPWTVEVPAEGAAQ